MIVSSRTLSLLLLVVTLAMSAQSTDRDVPFVAAFAPVNSNAAPDSGIMKLNFNHGIISGTYTDISIKPSAPLYNRRNVPVSGGVDSSGRATLIIGPLSFHGTLKGPIFRGYATVRGRRYAFEAHRGSPGKPAP